MISSEGEWVGLHARQLNVGAKAYATLTLGIVKFELAIIGS